MSQIWTEFRRGAQPARSSRNATIHRRADLDPKSRCEWHLPVEDAASDGGDNGSESCHRFMAGDDIEQEEVSNEDAAADA